MADVDQCTRCAEAGLCEDARENALRIAKISKAKRNAIFRGKSAEQIEGMLLAFSEKIKKTVSLKFGFDCNKLSASSNDNKDGADLYAVDPSGRKVIIEVKFGSYTDKAAGMGNFANIFGTTIFSDALSNDRRKMWRKMVRSEHPDLSKQLKRTADTLNEAALAFNKRMAENGHRLSKESQEFMEDYLLNNSGSYDSHTDRYIRFEVAQDGSDIHDVALVEKGRGVWQVEDIVPIDLSDDKARITVFAHNDETKLRIKFVLNNKNNWKFKDSGIKIRSKYMLNSPSWNVWIGKN